MRRELISCIQASLGNQTSLAPRFSAVLKIECYRTSAKATSFGRASRISPLDSATAQHLDDVLALRDMVEQLQGADLPKGFGRD
jgi:hypothetical protein